MKLRVDIIVALMIAFLLAPAWATGAEPAEQEQTEPQQQTETKSPLLTDTKAPIHIEADRMESDQKKEAVVFAGNVEAKQGDMVIRADEMTVFYQAEQEDEETGKQQAPASAGVAAGGKSIRKLFAKGNVKIVKEGWIASGDMVDYFAEERKVLLTGNTKVWQDNNMVSGETVTIFLDEGKSIVERSPEEGERVKAFFYPQ